ncbi:60S ribosomal protein L7-4 [Capsicum chinense]|nr:60S ribosomal protein L7-4 [Capsicum chinense]
MWRASHPSRRFYSTQLSNSLGHYKTLGYDTKFCHDSRLHSNRSLQPQVATSKPMSWKLSIRTYDIKHHSERKTYVISTLNVLDQDVKPKLTGDPWEEVKLKLTGDSSKEVKTKLTDNYVEGFKKTCDVVLEGVGSIEEVQIHDARTGYYSWKALAKKQELESAKKNNVENQKLIYNRAKLYAREYEQHELIHLKREARLKGGFYVDPEAKLLFIIKMRGIINGVFLKVSKATVNMFYRVEPDVTYGTHCQEIKTRIPDTISWDYNFEPAGSTPLSFTMKMDDVVVVCAIHSLLLEEVTCVLLFFSLCSPNERSSYETDSNVDLQEEMRNRMKDLAMRQVLLQPFNVEIVFALCSVFSYLMYIRGFIDIVFLMFSPMIKNMSPEMMDNMSEQFRVKLSQADPENHHSSERK